MSRKIKPGVLVQKAMKIDFYGMIKRKDCEERK